MNGPIELNTVLQSLVCLIMNQMMTNKVKYKKIFIVVHSRN